MSQLGIYRHRPTSAGMISGVKRVQTVMIGALFVAWTVPCAVLAQGGPAPGAAAGGGPIDIQAQEQEFAGDHVIAKGHVRVVYK
ncbi:MAG: hypothetical protein ACRD3W_13055, partial [Terriglobales bacterium]